MSSPQLSDAEWKVMTAVWRLADDITARAVHAAVAPATDWAYTTVKTMLDRLVDKGALSAMRVGKRTQYHPRLTRGAARRGAARALLGRAFGGAAGLLVHELVRSEPLSRADRARLRALLDAQDDEAHNEDDDPRDTEGSAS